LENRVFPRSRFLRFLVAAAGSAVALRPEILSRRPRPISSDGDGLRRCRGARHDFPHYLLFLIVPIGLLSGTVFGAVLAANAGRRKPASRCADRLCGRNAPRADRQSCPANRADELGDLLYFWRNPSLR